MPIDGDTTIDFCFDYISHNAYLAWCRLPAVAAAHGCTVRVVPVLFAGFLKAYGGLGPAEITPKLAWMNRNNLRKAAHLGVPLSAPRQHPFHPLFPLRLTAQPMPEPDRVTLATALLNAIWIDALDPNDRAAVSALVDRCGLDGAALVAGADSDAAKTALRANTDDAIARGAFGVPAMIVRGEVFWGYDDLDYLELVLAGRDPLAGVDVDAYERAWARARDAGQHRAR